LELVSRCSEVLFTRACGRGSGWVGVVECGTCWYAVACLTHFYGSVKCGGPGPGWLGVGWNECGQVICWVRWEDYSVLSTGGRVMGRLCVTLGAAMGWRTDGVFFGSARVRFL